MAFTAAKASLVNGLTCFCDLPWARAMPFITLLTALVVGGVVVASGPVERGQGSLVHVGSGPGVENGPGRR